MLLSLALSDPSNRPAIVYCGTRRDVEEVTERLRSEGLPAVGYHAGMAADERASAQHRFMEGDAEIVVATNAFGMGVDKADVRAVVHWAIPKSVEAYYQEVGRGGRDGVPARAILLSGRSDLGRLINFIKRDSVEAEDVLSFVRRLASSSGDGSVFDRPAAGGSGPGVLWGSPSARGCVALEPAGRGQLQVTLAGSTALAAARCRRSAAPHAIARGGRIGRSRSSARVSADAGAARCSITSATTRRARRSGVAATCAIPDTIGLPDPSSLTPAKARRLARG